MIRISRTIDKLMHKLGKAASLIIIAILFTTTFEVVSRYFFNHPTNWVWPINKQLFGFYILVAGSYSLLKGSHIRIEIFYDHFPEIVKKLVSYFSFVIFTSFVGVLVWQGYLMGSDSLSLKEHAEGLFPIALYPLKVFIPIAAAIFLAVGFSYFILKLEKLD